MSSLQSLGPVVGRGPEMAIEQRTVTLYRVSCDICGVLAPEAERKAEALLVAQGQGFRLYSRWAGLDYIYTALCLGCQDLWEKKGKAADMERVSPEELARRYQQEELLRDIFRGPAGRQEAR
jgi:hypothetical protein